MTNWTLKKHSFPGVKGPVVLVVMDGVGIGRHDESDAVFLARTPNLDFLHHNALYTSLQAHGTAVGLPSDDDMGNSEVGHNALGAGRVFDQGAKLVNQAIASGALFRGNVWVSSVKRVKESGQPLHFIGLLSDGNVHSHIDHLLALLSHAADEGVKKARVHVLLDGRDVPETSALQYVDQLEAALAKINENSERDYRIASGGGRMKITMDRYGAEWAMVQRGWAIHVRGEGRKYPSCRAAIESLRAENPGVIDQNLPGFVIGNADGTPVGPIQDGAAVILFNFRGDRAIELTRAFDDEKFIEFDRGPRPNVLYAGMMQYDGDLQLPKRYLVSPPEIEGTVSEFLAKNGVTQYASSETQKFGHVTYFWNGNRSGKFDDKLETYFEVKSDVKPFEERPWMKAAEISDALIDALKSGKYKHLRVNYANGDMVGHTGILESAIAAVNAVDIQLGRLIPVVAALEGALVVTADHGNADEMFEWDKKKKTFVVDKNGKRAPKTSHTLNPVPFYVHCAGLPLAIDTAVAKPGLGNIAATLLTLMGYLAPDGYMPSLLK